MNPTGQGVAAAVLSNILFGVIYLYSAWLKPLSGTDVFAWRMVVMLGGLWLLVFATGAWPQLKAFLRETGRNWRRWAGILAATPLVAAQLWLFMWAPVNGHGVNAATGYFLFPLMMVVFARLFLGERPNRWQKVALALAAAGVLYEIWQTQALAWTTWAVCLGYPPYYLLRRQMRVPALFGLLIDLTVIAPFAALYLWLNGSGMGDAAWSWKYLLLIPLLGILSAASMQLNLNASRLLPVPLFGILSYLEPVLLFLGAWLLLDTPVAAESWPAYALIIAALAVSGFDGLLKLCRTRYAKVPVQAV
ncbi:EamA family transporter RarD [Neisseria leonii]|uniref:EamA family transporter RarD n=1 Tax=Neisseria leonii TaxID=2995413 RepID=UPI00237BFCBA|nr:EamA family transporter RarD [Neisseria sp. 3986]MDD9325662.1 EamA family transporter RarD [Neisseria sp. 3986]